MKVYISGPMSGLPEFNYPAFHAAAKAWRDAGHEVLSPAENFAGDTTRTYAEYMRRDIELLLEVEAIALLPGWEKSRGASLEMAITAVLGLPAYDALSFERLERSAA